MSHTEYQFGTHADVPDLIPQLVRLSNLAFAQYDGAMPVDETFMEWYLRRPGSRPELCTAALREGELVSNVLVAIQDLRLGREVLPCGIIDTVATAPDHRRRGLARRLMDDAHRLMQEAGANAAVLYTNPDGHPYRFYQRLGYETRAFGAALLGERPAPSEGPVPEPARSQDKRAICELLDAYHARYEGYAPMTEALWRWHRSERPESMPIHLLVIPDAKQSVVATAAFAEVELLIEGQQAPGAVLSNFACAAEEARCLRAFLAAAPSERILAFVDVETPAHSMLTASGFSQAVREAAMVLPFTERARAAMERRTGPWYVMIESVVGV